MYDALQDYAPSYDTISLGTWVKSRSFAAGRGDVSDAARSGRPVTTEETARVDELIREDRRFHSHSVTQY